MEFDDELELDMHLWKLEALVFLSFHMMHDFIQESCILYNVCPYRWFLNNFVFANSKRNPIQLILTLLIAKIPLEKSSMNNLMLGKRIHNHNVLH